MTLEGSLQDFSIVELLQLIAMGNKTGILEVEEETSSNKATVYFDTGVLTHIKLKKNVEPLNVMLIKSGLISREQSKFAHQYQQNMVKKERYGAVLLKLNYISKHNLRKIVKQQMEEALYNVFDWTKGAFKFYEVSEVEDADFPLNMTAENLILEGSRRQDEWGQIQTIIPHPDVYFRFKEGDDGSQFLDLDPVEWEIMTNIDGQSTARELAMRLGMGNFETCKLLVNLIEKGIIEVVPESIDRGKESA